MTNKISMTDKTAAPSWHTLLVDNVIKRLGTDIVTGGRAAPRWKKGVVVEAVKRVKKNSPLLFAYYFVRKERM